jgi:Domain of unknown function (DUF4864)
MRRLAFGLLALFFAFAATARADDSADARAIISQQLDAFTHDDAPAAWALAAPAIREKFSDADAFMAMVKTAYPPVYRRRSVEFGKQSREGDEIAQEMVFVDESNDVWAGVYKLERQGDGDWKITGCVLIRAKESSL